MGGHGVVDGRVDVAHHPPVGELGQEAVDGLVQPEHTFLEEDHRRHRGDRLGHGGDAEDRVTLDRAAAERGGTDDVDMGLVPAADHRHQTGRSRPVDVAFHDVVQAGETLPGEW